MAPPSATAPSAPASIEGDVYLLMQSGDVRKGAGLKVRLLAAPDSVLAELATNCSSYHAEYVQIPANNYAAFTPVFDRATAAADHILAAHMISESGTGMNAHFKFDNLKPGHYALHTSFPIGDHNYQWIVPITVSAGQHVTRDLDAEAENNKVVYCNIR